MNSASHHDTPSIQALEALFRNYNDESVLVSGELISLFKEDYRITQKLTAFDSFFVKNPDYKELEEYIFDLLIASHLHEMGDDEDYMKGREWQDIEDQTMERGTELLSILHYLSEAGENDVEISLDDFLHEFMLVDDDEFQDAHQIYEPLIMHPELVFESGEDILAASRAIECNDELKDLLLPLLLMFNDIHSFQSGLLPAMKPIERALYAALMAYAGKSVVE